MRRARRFLVIVATLLLLLLLLGGGLLALSSIHTSQTMVRPLQTTVRHPAKTFIATPPPAPQGVAWFYDLHGQSDSIALHLRYLPEPPKDKVYIGWLINPHRPDQFLTTGPLLPDKAGNVAFWSDQFPSFNTNVQDLRLLFTQLIVTTENAASQPQRPIGPLVLHGRIGQNALDDIAQVFTTASYTPNQVALLPGLRSQMRELGRWMANMLDALQHNDVATVHNDLLRLIYIIEGANGADVLRLNINSTTLPNVVNAGDGFGLVSSSPNCQVSQYTCGYLDALYATLQTLAKQGAISQTTMQNLFISLATVNQLTQVAQRQVLSLLKVSTLDMPAHYALTTLGTGVDALLNGSDRDGDGSIDAVPGEAATAQLYTYMQQVGAINLSAAS